MITAFVSGHRDITDDEFNKFYVPKLMSAIADGHRIVVGDYQGVDYLTQRWLKDRGYTNVIVYHMFIKPRYYVEGFPLRGGYISDEDRDSSMTKDSDYDIAYVRVGKENSGTAINLARRINLATPKLDDPKEYSKAVSDMLDLFTKFDFAEVFSGIK